MQTILTNCTVIDCTGQAPQDSMTVVIEGDKITGLSSGSVDRAGARVLDLEGGYVLPGLWEVHTHLGDLIPDPHNLLETEAIGDYTIRAGRNAMDALRAGITGIRVVGESSFVDVAWKRAFEAGVMVGPRLFVCTRGISITGGHGHGTLGALEVDGPWEMRKAVRENLKHGADQIKLMVTGGIMTEGETMQESQFLLDEIQAATEVAHQKGKRVAVHAWGAPGIKTAIQGGVDSIEHGLLDDEAIQMMLAHDVFYVPTISATQDEEFMKELPEFHVKKARAAAGAHLEGFQKAFKAGVKIACGSDSTPTAEFTRRELEYMVKAGMSEMEALIAATRTGADLCEVADRLGTIEVGKLADLLVLSANPLEDISNVRKVKRVLKNGKLVNLEQDEGLTDYLELYC
jgi:imidazolonepropionase-like amidohydrolase